MQLTPCYQTTISVASRFAQSIEHSTFNAALRAANFAFVTVEMRLGSAPDTDAKEAEKRQYQDAVKRASAYLRDEEVFVRIRRQGG